MELYADTFEVALQGFVHFLNFFGIVVGRVRIKLRQHLDNGLFHQSVLIHGVHVEVGYGKLCHLQLAEGFIAHFLSLRRYGTYTYYNSKNLLHYSCH